MIVICVSGSRSVRGYWIFSRLMRKIIKEITDAGETVKIIEGMCFYGGDYLARIFAHRNKIPIQHYPAKWEEHGKAAGFIRNKDLIEEADRLVAVHDGVSKGTLNAVEYAQDKKIDVIILNMEGCENYKERRINKLRRLQRLGKRPTVK